MSDKVIKFELGLRLALDVKMMSNACSSLPLPMEYELPRHYMFSVFGGRWGRVFAAKFANAHLLRVLKHQDSFQR